MRRRDASAGSLRPRSAAVGWARRLLALVALAALVTAMAGGSALARSSTAPATTKVTAVPKGFVGVDADGPLFAPQTPLNFSNQVKSMVANGVQSIRVAFSWAAAEPVENEDQIPAPYESYFTDVDGHPIDFSATDAVVDAAARLHVTILPTILYTPSWDAERNPTGIAMPKRDAPYAAYAAALVQRYGPGGVFWSEHPGLPQVPITMVQIWNEPNIAYYWKQPFAKGYVALLRAAHQAIKAADPSVQVVLGSLTNFAWKSIGQIYELGNTRSLFDIVAVNAFTQTPADVMLYLRLMRNAMSHFDDGKKPLLATELSWPSAVGKTSQKYDFNTTPAGQARDIAQLLPLIGQQRVSLGLAGFYYYTWIGNETPPQPLAFNYAGLLRYDNGKVSVKPALGAFKTGALALEQCRQKGSVATSCLSPAS